MLAYYWSNRLMSSSYANRGPFIRIWREILTADRVCCFVTKDAMRTPNKETLSAPSTPASSGRKSFTLAFKRSCLLRFDACENVSKVARDMGISRQHVNRWRKQRADIMAVTGPVSQQKRKRKRSGGATAYPYSPEGAARKRRRIRYIIFFKFKYIFRKI